MGADAGNCRHLEHEEHIFFFLFLPGWRIRSEIHPSFLLFTVSRFWSAILDPRPASTLCLLLFYNLPQYLLFQFWFWMGKKGGDLGFQLSQTQLKQTTRLALSISRWSIIISWFAGTFPSIFGNLQRFVWTCFLLRALSSAACLNLALLPLFCIFRQHQRASLPTSCSSCWTLEPTHPSKTWRALCPRKSPNPAPSPPSCVSTRPRKTKPPGRHLVSLCLRTAGAGKVFFDFTCKCSRRVWFLSAVKCKH